MPVQEVADQFISVILADIRQNCLKLPTLPELAVKVRKLAQDESSNAGQLAKLINTDAALSARLVRVSNSPLYRGTSVITSVQMAITRLGNTTVRNLVSSLVMQQLFQMPSLLRERMRTVWNHSAEVAVISQILARNFTKLQPDEAMLAGLLHDIGTLPILSRAEDFPQILRNPEALENAIETLHTQIGKILLETWNFSPEIVAAAAEHEDLGRYTAEVDYADVVLVANLHSYVGKNHHLATVDWGNVPAFAKLGMSPAQSLLAINEAKAEIAETMALLGL
jgi:putative nucleotidyltransferase with HDIG domain